MKQGWIQVQNNGAQEQLAPKTMADMVYVDEAQNKTVKDALAEGFVAVFEHTMSLVNGRRVHNFEGPSGFKGIGRALITELILENDQIMFNGLIRNAYQGSERFFTLPQGYWETFMVDETSVNFRMGGRGAMVKVIAIASALLLPATARDGYVAIVSRINPGKVYIGAQRPTAGMSVGDVFIRTVSLLSYALPIGLDGRAVIYPAEVEQYNGSAWATCVSYIRTGGSWIETAYVIYSNGENLKGAWNSTGSGGKILVSADKFNVYCSNNANGTTSNIVICANNMDFDMTEFKTMHMLATVVNSSSASTIWSVAIGVGSEPVVALDAGTMAEYTLDISGIIGLNHPVIHAGVSRKENLKRSIDVYRVWFTR